MASSHRIGRWMASTRRGARWVVRKLLVLVAILLLLYIGIGITLNTASGRRVVAERLSPLVGLPVEVTSVSLGWNWTSIGFRILDPAIQGEPNAAILSVGGASVDVALTSLLAGRISPNEVRIRGVALRLRLGADGAIRTTMPQLPESSGGGDTKIPRVSLEEVEVRVHQEGRPEFTLTGLNLRVEPSGDTIALVGSISDPGWGEWKLSGELNAKSETGWVEVTANDAPLKTDGLRSIPFLPASIWDNLQVDGRCRIAGRFDLGPHNALNYDAKVQTHGVTLAVPPAEIALTNLTAMIHVHDEQVEIRGIDDNLRATGTLAGGLVSVSGKLDYGKKPITLDPLELEIEKLAVKDLPPSWGVEKARGKLPGKLTLRDGLVSGTARLRVVLTEEGRIESYGGGIATFEIPRFAGGSVSLKVKVGGDGKKLDFTPQAPASKPDLQTHAPEPTRWIGPTVRHNRADSTGQPFAELVSVLYLRPTADSDAEGGYADDAAIDATLNLTNVNIAEVLGQVGMELPYPISGRTSLHAKLDVPLGQVANPASFRLNGSLSSPDLTIDGMKVQGLEARIQGRDGNLDLTELRGTIAQAGVANAPVGKFHGTARVALAPPGPVTADLTLDALPVAALLGVVPGAKLDGTGFVSGRADFEAPFGKITDPSAWRVRATVASNGVRVAGRTATAVNLSVIATHGTATLVNTKATIEGVPLAITGTLGLTGKHEFNAALTTTGTRIADLKKLAVKTKLPVELDGELDTVSKVVGTLSPLVFTGSGTIRAKELKIGKSVANTVKANWTANTSGVQVPRLDVAMFDGTITGSLDFPFAADRSGTFGLAFQDIDTAPVAAAIPGFKRRVEGRVGGNVTGTLTPAKEGESRDANVELTFGSQDLRVQVIDPKKLAPIGKLSGKVTLKDGTLGYHLTADIAKGKLAFDRPAVENVESKEVRSSDPGRGSMRLTDVDLTQLGKDLAIDFLRPLRGKFSVSFVHDEEFKNGTGKVAIRELTWDREQVPSEIGGAITLRDGELNLNNFGGPFARGHLRARMLIRVDDPTRNSLVLAITQADAKRLLAPAPDLADLIDGKVTINLQARLGDTQRALGTVVLTTGSVAGVSVPELRIPVDYTSYPGGYGQLTIRDATARAGTGRATASATVQWGSTTRLDGKVQFLKLPLRSLVPSVGNSSVFGNGRISGQFDIAGRNVRSADDLTGKLVARLDNATVAEIPLLRQTIPYLNTLGLTKPFDTGDVQGNLSRGVFRVQRLAMTSPAAQLFASGSVTVAGRLDVDVTAHTGEVGPSPGAVKLLQLAIPAVGPIPLGLISDVSAFMSDRTVKLTIGGTTDSPKIRLNTAFLLRDEAVRFFINRYVPPSVSNAFSAGGIANIAQDQLKK